MEIKDQDGIGLFFGRSIVEIDMFGKYFLENKFQFDDYHFSIQDCQHLSF